MKNYKRKALLLSVLLTICFVSMYVMLTISSQRAFFDAGYWTKNFYLRLVNNAVVGLLIAFLPYELLFSKISRMYFDWFLEEKQKKLFWVNITLLIINVLLGIFACVVRSGIGFYMGSANRRFQYVMLFFVCLCIWIIICSNEIENRVLRCTIRNFATLFNGFLVLFITGTMGQAVIVIVAMTALIIVYDVVLRKKVNPKEIAATIAVGVIATTGGLLAKEYHNIEELGDLSQILFRPFELVNTQLGFGYLVLFVFIVAITAAVLIFSIKVMSKKSSVRTGFLTAVAVLYICAFAYISLAMFEIVPCCEVQMITNRIHIVVWLLTLRCFIIIPVPPKTKTENPSFVERILNSGTDEDSEIDWIEDKIETLMRKQNLIIEYVTVLDLKVEELSCGAGDNKEEKLKEIAETRQRLKELNVPMDIGELVAKLREIQDEKEDRNGLSDR